MVGKDWEFDSRKGPPTFEADANDLRFAFGTANTDVFETLLKHSTEWRTLTFEGNVNGFGRNIRRKFAIAAGVAHKNES